VIGHIGKNRQLCITSQPLARGDSDTFNGYAVAAPGSIAKTKPTSLRSLSWGLFPHCAHEIESAIITNK